MYGGVHFQECYTYRRKFFIYDNQRWAWFWKSNHDRENQSSDFFLFEIIFIWMISFKINLF